ncbi:MAG: M81 family metallopeptidase [Caldilineaceae bacterium]
MKLFVGSVATETNTFSPMPTGRADFDVIRGDEFTAERAGEMGEFEALHQAALAGGHELVFSLAAFAQPAGITVRSAYESLRDECLTMLKASLPVDIVFLPLHGAMIADGYDDCEGDMIDRVRQIVGPDVVIAVELDLHCHLTQFMLDHADLIVIYKEYPHVDPGLRMKELFNLAVATKQGKIKPKMALFDCKMIGFYYTPYEPMRSFVDSMIAAEGKDGILSLSLAHCFPWGDMPDCGARMLAVVDRDAEKAKQVAEAWGRKFYNQRHTITASSVPMAQALDQAMANPKGPVVIADQADNAGGGAPSDSTFVLRELLRRGITDAGIAMFWDPIVVNLAKAAGAGATLQVRLGGKLGPMSGDPLDLTVKVIGTIDKMTQRWPQQNSEPVIGQCGDAVALSCNGIDIIVNNKRTQVLGPDVFTNFGIDVTQKKLLVVKSTQHFYAGYAPIASQIIYMAAPGAIAPIMKEIPFQRVDLNKYPWVDDPLGA